MRDHNPIVIEEFNGLWARGDVDSTPPDHFSDVNNIQYIESGFKTRDGIDTFLNKGNVLRIYAFNTNADGLLFLDTNGDFYHVIASGTVVVSVTLILHIAGATDFKYVNINNRAYITPIGAGLIDFIYVYNGDGTTARKAAGLPPVDVDGALAAANSGGTGNVEAGIHVFGVVYETNSGFQTQIGPDTLPTVTAPGGDSVDLSNIPISPSSFVTGRRIVATQAIDPTLYTGNTRGYQFFFVPDGTINDNTTTTLTVSFFDAELLEDASDLSDLLTEIPRSSGLTTYHNRLISYGENDPNTSLIRVSNPGEPEAISAVDGLILLPNNGNGLTNAYVYRDILYITKINQTFAVVDNGDVPSSWSVTVIDNGIGSAGHGIGIVDNTVGEQDTEYVIHLDLNGIFLFNGTFAKPELSFKIHDFWLQTTSDQFDTFQVYNDVQHQIIYINIPYLKMILIGDYTEGLNPTQIKWGKWTFDIEPTSITLFNKVQDLIIGSKNGVITVTFTLSVTSGSGSGTYLPAVVVPVIANAPPSGQQFANWIGDVGSVANASLASTTVTMPSANVAIQATYFTPIPTTFTLSVNFGSGSGSFVSGTIVPIVANDPAPGQLFSQWTGDTGSVASTTAASTTVTILSANLSLTATYITPPPVLFTLTVINGTGSGSFTATSIININANTPPVGTIFDSWTGDTASLANASSPNTIVTMPSANVTVQATYFTPIPVTSVLTVNSGSGSGSYTSGTIVPIVANTPPSGQLFSNWTGDVVSVASTTSASTTITMLSIDLTITANYVTPPPTVFILTVINGSGSGSYHVGNIVPIVSVAPPAGDNFDRWTGDDGDISNILLPNSSITMPNHDVIITATFIPIVVVIPPPDEGLFDISNLSWQGAFREPIGLYDFGGQGLEYNPTNNSLFVSGNVQFNNTSEISIPVTDPSNTTNIAALPRAAVIQPLTDIFEGKIRLIDNGGTDSVVIGGYFLSGGSLYATAYIYYDGGGNQTLSHFKINPNFAITGDVQGPFASNQIAGIISGYMCDIPSEWQSALGGTALTGNSALSIIERSSYGPSCSSFTPSTLGVTVPFPVNTLVYYPQAHPLASWNDTGRVFNGSTNITGIVFVPNTRSILFVGRQGIGPACYGEGAACGDPTDSSKGFHAFPYRYYIWAYDANDFILVRTGAKQSWEIRPYAIWDLGMNFAVTKAHLDGVAINNSTLTLYLKQGFSDGAAALIHVYKIVQSIPINVGDDWQAAINGNPAGTRFIIKTGIHRFQSITPKDNNQFIGETGAIMTGGRVLTSPVGSNPWSWPNQHQHGTYNNPGGNAYQAGHEASGHPEDLFYDNVVKNAVSNFSDGGPGDFFFDYANAIIYCWDDPSGHVVETSVTPKAINAVGVNNVIIQNIIIDKYAVVTENAAVSLSNGSVVQDCEIRYCHYAGAESGSNSIIKDNHIHHNGVFGLIGSGDNLVIISNEVDHNNTVFGDAFNGAGGSKWVISNGVIVTNNYVHDNLGPGFWCDINNINIIFDSNLFEDNQRAGAFIEISYSATISNNIFRRNGNTFFGSYPSEGAIAIVDSPDCTVFGNLLEENKFGIGGLEDPRALTPEDPGGNGTNGPIHGNWLLRNLNVHDNTVTALTLQSLNGIEQFNGNGPYTSQNNNWQHDTYNMSVSIANYFTWISGPCDDTAWRGFGLDVSGTFNRV